MAEELNGSPRLQALLGFLIVHRGRAVERGQLAGTLWPEATEAQARRNLNSHLWRLRQVADGMLAAGLEATAQTVQWQVPPGAWLDVDHFEAQTTPLLGGSPDASVADAATLARLAQGVALYSGPLLDGCDANWCAPPRQRLHERYVLALETLIEGHEAREELRPALAHAEALVEAEPYRESGHAASIRLRLALNEPGAARAALRRYEQLWQEELGLPPSPRLRHLLAAPPTLVVPDATPQATGPLAGWMGLLDVAGRSSPLQAAQQEAWDALYDAVAEGALRMGAAAEGEQSWTVARQIYERALATLEGSSAGTLRQQLTLRLRCNALYDRAAAREVQAANLGHALALAERLADEAAQSEVWAHRCWLAQREGRLPDAVACGEQALALAGEAPSLRPQALRLLGISHDLQGAYRQALFYHQQARALNQERPAWRCLDHVNLASVHGSLGEPWAARLHARAALALTDAAKPTAARVLALGNLANLERELGRGGEARDALQEAQGIATMLGLRESETWLACRAATLYRWQGDMAQATLWAERAWTLSVALGDPRYPIEAAFEAGELAMVHQDIAQAAEWLERAAEWQQRSGLARYVAPVALARAQLALRLGRLRVAASAGREALTALRATDERRLLPLCHALRAAIAHCQGSDATAARRLAMARAALHEITQAILNPAARDSFVQATPLRRLLAEGADVDQVAALWVKL